jgi:hypothetical protein
MNGKGIIKTPLQKFESDFRPVCRAGEIGPLGAGGIGRQTVSRQGSFIKEER